MKPITFPEKNIKMGPPEGMTEAECKTVDACKTDQAVITEWLPSQRELMLLTMGHPVWLYCLGSTMPPVAVGVVGTDGLFDSLQLDEDHESAEGVAVGAVPQIFKDGVTLIQDERERQLNVEAWTRDHDRAHVDHELALAAACYTLPPTHGIRAERSSFNAPRLWPWDEKWWKPGVRELMGADESRAGRIRELAKAGALIAAELDRLQHEERRRVAKALTVVQEEYWETQARRQQEPVSGGTVEGVPREGTPG